MIAIHRHTSRLPIAVSFAITVLLGAVLLGNSRAASALEHNPLSPAKNVQQAISVADPSAWRSPHTPLSATSIGKLETEPSCVVNVHGGADYTRIQDAI